MNSLQLPHTTRQHRQRIISRSTTNLQNRRTRRRIHRHTLTYTQKARRTSSFPKLRTRVRTVRSPLTTNFVNRVSTLHLSQTRQTRKVHAHTNQINKHQLISYRIRHRLKRRRSISPRTIRIQRRHNQHERRARHQYASRPRRQRRQNTQFIQRTHRRSRHSRRSSRQRLSTVTQRRISRNRTHINLSRTNDHSQRTHRRVILTTSRTSLTRSTRNLIRNVSSLPIRPTLNLRRT